MGSEEVYIKRPAKDIRRKWRHLVSLAAGEGKNGYCGPSRPPELVNAQHFDNRDEDTDAEVQRAHGFRGEDSRKRHAALPEGDDQAAFMVRDEIGDRPVKGCNEQPEHQPGDFEQHSAIVPAVAGAAQ